MPHGAMCCARPDVSFWQACGFFCASLSGLQADAFVCWFALSPPVRRNRFPALTIPETLRFMRKLHVPRHRFGGGFGPVSTVLRFVRRIGSFDALSCLSTHVGVATKTKGTARPTPIGSKSRNCLSDGGSRMSQRLRSSSSLPFAGIRKKPIPERSGTSSPVQLLLRKMNRRRLRPSVEPKCRLPGATPRRRNRQWRA